MNPVYIKKATALIPQHQDSPLFAPLVRDVNEQLVIIEPDYSAVIPPMQLRRMSRILKMGVYTGITCLKAAGVEKPDGIITGTAKGSMPDTERFVKELRQYNEGAMNPTPFILSTYNAINGAIALQTGATGYNQTYVHRGNSFESALFDAQLKLREAQHVENYLVGSFDELTQEHHHIKAKAGYWKKDRNNNLPLWNQNNSAGTIAGEGVSFFVVTNEQSKGSLAIHKIDTFYRPAFSEINDRISNDLHSIGWAREDIDLLVMGINGDAESDQYYMNALGMFNQETPVIAFKHLCGEYETAGGFALWLLTKIAEDVEISDEIWYRQGATKEGKKKVLLYNHFRGINHNLILIEL